MTAWLTRFREGILRCQEDGCDVSTNSDLGWWLLDKTGLNDDRKERLTSRLSTNYDYGEVEKLLLQVYLGVHLRERRERNVQQLKSGMPFGRRTANVADGGDTAYLMGCFPSVEIEPRGNWDVLGLRGTQSIDYGVHGVRVPQSCAFDFFAPVVHRGSAKHRFGVIPLTAVGHAAWALGVTRRMLDELALVVATGEMGRTPRANAQWGRDHWSTLFPSVLAGAGVSGAPHGLINYDNLIIVIDNG